MEAGPLDRPYRDEDDLYDPSRAQDSPHTADGALGVNVAPGFAADGRAEFGDGLGILEDVPGGQESGDRGVDDLDVDDRGAGERDRGNQDPDEHELRPERKLRLWQTAPIVALGVLGSLMFAFPLAFGFGDQGAVVAMLGLLLSASSAGWGIMIARRVGYTWPGLPQRGSGGRPDWRFVAAYVLLCVLIGVLAVWRVARLH